MTSGHHFWATGCKSFRPKPKPCAAKPEIVAASVSRLRSGSLKIKAVSRPAAGLTMTNCASGSSIGVMRSPTPSTHADWPCKKKGTSAPRAKAMGSKRSSGQCNCHKRLRAIKVLAASDEPPPNPAWAGRRLSNVMCAPHDTPDAV